MLQRIQSVFLFLASLAIVSLFKFPFAQSNQSEAPFFEDQVFSISDNTILMVLAVLGAIASFISIFLYNNRLLQMRIVLLSLIFSLFLGIVAVWLVYTNASLWSSNLEINDGLGIYLSAGALILIILANIFIKKDENTVRSMDRLR